MWSDGFHISSWTWLNYVSYRVMSFKKKNKNFPIIETWTMRLPPTASNEIIKIPLFFNGLIPNIYWSAMWKINTRSNCFFLSKLHNQMFMKWLLIWCCLSLYLVPCLCSGPLQSSPSSGPMSTHSIPIKRYDSVILVPPIISMPWRSPL